MHKQYLQQLDLVVALVDVAAVVGIVAAALCTVSLAALKILVLDTCSPKGKELGSQHGISVSSIAEPLSC